MSVGSCVVLDFHFKDKTCSSNMLLCFAEERMSYKFEMTWERANDDRIFIFG